MITIKKSIFLLALLASRVTYATSYICKTNGSSTIDGVYLLNSSNSELKLCHYKEQDNGKLKLIESGFGTISNQLGKKDGDIIFLNSQSNITINKNDISGDSFELSYEYDFGIGLGPKAFSKSVSINTAFCQIDHSNSNCPASKFQEPKNLPINNAKFIRRLQDAVDWEGEKNPIFSLVSKDLKSFTIITFKEGHFWVGEYFQDGGSGPFANIKVEAAKKLKEEYLTKGWTLVGAPYYTKSGLELFNKLSK